MYSITGHEEWNIQNRVDFETAMTKLREAEFCAEMSDSYAVTCTEKAEIARQRFEIFKQAKDRAYVWLDLTEEQQEMILAEIPTANEHGKCVEYRQNAFHDVHVFEDGHEERYYIGD